MVFTNHDLTEQINVKIGTESIKQVSSTKFLGVWIDEKLNWNQHVKHLTSRMASGIYALKSVKNLLSPSSKEMIYSAFYKVIFFMD